MEVKKFLIERSLYVSYEFQNLLVAIRGTLQFNS